MMCSYTVVPVMEDLPYRTCMNYGPEYYRTFDGLEFLFPGRCTYSIYSDGITAIIMETVNCHRVFTCRKVGLLFVVIS